MSHTFADFLIRILREICWYVFTDNSEILEGFIKNSNHKSR